MDKSTFVQDRYYPTKWADVEAFLPFWGREVVRRTQAVGLRPELMTVETFSRAIVLASKPNGLGGMLYVQLTFDKRDRFWELVVSPNSSGPWFPLRVAQEWAGLGATGFEGDGGACTPNSPELAAQLERIWTCLPRSALATCAEWFRLADEMREDPS